METQKGSRRTAASRKLMVETASTGRTEAVVFWGQFPVTPHTREVAANCVLLGFLNTVPSGRILTAT